MTVATTTTPTNSVLLQLHPVKDAVGMTQRLAIRKQLATVGDIASIKEIREKNWMQVTFFDARCAARVMSFCKNSCRYATQEGCRTVVLDKDSMGSFELSQASDISIMEDGRFKVEFFDIRMAAKAASFACSSVTQAEHLEGDDSTSVSSGANEEVASNSSKEEKAKPEAAAEAKAVAAPRKVVNMQLSQLNWEDLATSREWRTVLHLRGLPASLLQPGMFEAYLEKAGLKDSVSKVKVPQMAASTKKSGCAVLKAASVEAVKELAKHFHGRQFGNSLVAVSFAADQGKPQARKKPEAASRGADQVSRLQEPLHIPTKGSQGGASPAVQAPQRSASTTTPCLPTMAMSMDTLPLMDCPPGLGPAAGLRPPPGLENLVPAYIR